jgi:hypothetical protein
LQPPLTSSSSAIKPRVCCLRVLWFLELLTRGA